MDGKMPTQRWQLKAMEQGVQRLNLTKQSLESSASVGCSTSLLGTSLLNLSLSTPVLSGGSSGGGSSRMSPARSPGRLSRTPANKKSPSRRSSSTPSLSAPSSNLDSSLSLRAGANRTPSRTGAGSRTPVGDRFIPCRSATDLENSYNSLLRTSSVGSAAGGSNSQDASVPSVSGAGDDSTNGNNSLMTRPTNDFQRQLMSDTLNNGASRDSRILCFQARPPRPSTAHTNNLRVLYSSSKSAVSRAPSTRHIASAPDRVLDAPDLLDDYYLHLLDWSAGNQLAVALASAVYVWNASGGGTSCLAQLDADTYVCSLSWVPESAGGGSGSSVLAVGDSAGNVQLWDASRQQRLRVMRGHRDRVATVAWNNHIVSSGSRCGDIHHYDVRVANFHVGSYCGGHVQEVCGLRWSGDGRLLASGGNDNQLLIWDSLAGFGGGDGAEPLHVLNQHQAAVKALAWCPWSQHVLASGGGTADRCIRFWNGSSGQLFNTVTTNSQVSSLLWSNDYKEIMSGHGFSFNQLTLWKYPQMDKVIDLTGHDSRVLELALSPDGSTVASAAGDETIRLWKCWQTDPAVKKNKSTRSNASSAFKLQSIR